MKFNYNWLKELSGTKKSPEELAELLTMRAFEIEGIEKAENFLDDVVVGEIVSVEKHPNADKLQLTKVNVGNSQILKIVCGAPNIEVGQKVPVALIGAELPGGFKIKESEIRGEKSYGMLCAKDELGLGDNHEGILILDNDIETGTKLSEVLKISQETILDIDILSNRGHDAMSHVGMAREISALEKSFTAKF